MPTAPKDAAASHAAYTVAPRRFPLLRRTMRVYRALILTLLTGLAGAVLLVPLLRDPAHYLAGLRGEWTFAVALASQDPTQIAAGGVVIVALFALSWLSDHAYQREVQINPLPAASPVLPPASPATDPMPSPTNVGASGGRPALPTAPAPDAPAVAPAAPSRAPSPTPDHAFTSRVFISHAGADHAFCVRLANDLRAALGGDPDRVYYDRDPQDGTGGLEGGQHFPRALAQEIAERNVFAVILSPEAVASDWVQWEINHGLISSMDPTRRTVLIPVLYRSCVPPETLLDVQFVPFVPVASPMGVPSPREVAPADYQRGFDKLLEAIQAGVTARRKGEGEPPFDLATLPVPDHFVGRVKDLEWVLARLRGGETTGITSIPNTQAGPRVAALGGMGGLGKTALAGVVVRVLYAEGRFPGGIAVVVCAGLTDPVEVLRQVLTRFDAQRRAPEASDLPGLAETASKLLAGKQALAVLDNVEPGWPVDKVIEPLRTAGATVLVTARQRLPGAAVPVEGTRLLDLLSPAEALTLFAQSYGRADAAALNAAERAYAEKIVSELDRHTLAVKLAGAYAATEGRDLAAVARELANPLKALALPEDEVPEKVQRIFAASFEALDGDAQRLFAALAAFPTNEFGRLAALALAGTLRLTDSETSLRLLVLRALLEASTNETLPAGGESDRERLRLHPLLRAFAGSEFARWPAAERTAAERAVAEFYAEYTTSLDYLDVAANNSRAVDEANITGAIEWAHAHGEGELVAGLCNSMGQFWRDRGKTAASLHYLPWGVAAAEKLLGERPDDGGNGDGQKSEALTAWERHADRLFWLMLNDGYSFYATGKLNEAQHRYERCLTLAQQAHARRNEGAALSVLGQVAQRRGRLDAATGYYEQSLAIDREVGDRQGEGVVLNQLGQVAQLRGRLDAAVRYYEQSLAIRREVGDRQGEGVDLSQLGQVAQRRGRLDEATGYYEQSLAILHEVGDRQGEGVDLFSLALIEEARGNLDRAEAWHRESLVIGIEVQSGQDIADSYLELGSFLNQHGRGQPGEGCGMLRAAVRLYHEMGLSDEEDAARAALAKWGCGAGDEGAAAAG